jgi:shikimate kinase
MIVAPLRTANEEAALAAGHRTSAGVHMLLHQAREQVRLVCGRTGDYYAMRDAGAAALRDAMRIVVLVGLRCTGKTEAGRRLARLTGRDFLDTDAEVEARTGRSPDAMIRAGDEAAFRAAEADVLAECLGRPGAVVATGGGAALHADLLRSASVLWPIVLLDAPDDVLLARWAAEPRAPLSALALPDELLRQRAERMPLYVQLRRLEVDTSLLTPDEAAEHIAETDDEGW